MQSKGRVKTSSGVRLRVEVLINSAEFCHRSYPLANISFKSESYSQHYLPRPPCGERVPCEQIHYRHLDHAVLNEKLTSKLIGTIANANFSSTGISGVAS